jgi:hypothetical protein
LALQCGPPLPFQFFEWKGEGISFREHQEQMISGQLQAHLPGQLTEETFCTIPPDRNTEPFADDNADTARRGVSPANEQVEARSGQPTSVLLHIFDVAASPKKKQPISCTVRCLTHSGPRETRARFLRSEFGRTAP